jgi:hypothetical protein
VTLTVGDLGVCIVIDSLCVVVLLREDALEGRRTVESIDRVDGLRTRSPKLLVFGEDGVRLVLTDGTDKYGDGAGATLPASD